MVLAIVDGEQGLGAPVAWGAAFFAIVSYAALLRPAVRVEKGTLVLRNMLDTNVVPLAAVEEVAVRQVLAVRAEEKRYVSPAIGHSFMRTIRPKVARDGRWRSSYPDYVRDRILLPRPTAPAGGRATPICRPCGTSLRWPEIAGLSSPPSAASVSIILDAHAAPDRPRGLAGARPVLDHRTACRDSDAGGRLEVGADGVEPAGGGDAGRRRRRRRDAPGRRPRGST